MRGIRILVDGIPATLPDGQSTLDHLDVGSLGRVEVLRGPASALYGNGAGGVILFGSAPPFAGTYRQDLSVVAGSDGLLRVQTTGSGHRGEGRYSRQRSPHRVRRLQKQRFRIRRGTRTAGRRGLRSPPP